MRLVNGMLNNYIRRDMLSKLVNIYNYLIDSNNWCESRDRTFYIIFLIWVSLSSYLMIGLYYYYPKVLDMLYWPLN